MAHRKRCRFCRCLFFPDPRVASRQRACTREACQSKRVASYNRVYAASHKVKRRAYEVSRGVAMFPMRVPPLVASVLAALQVVISKKPLSMQVVVLDSALRRLQVVMGRQRVVSKGEFPELPTGPP